MSYGVSIIIGTTFSELDQLCSRIHVWAPQVPLYQEIADCLRETSSEYSAETGITLYFYEQAETPEETFLSLLDTVDAQHGELRHNPPWTFMEIYGLEPTPAVKDALNIHGVNEIQPLINGFVAHR